MVDLREYKKSYYQIERESQFLNNDFDYKSIKQESEFKLPDIDQRSSTPKNYGYNKELAL